MNTILGIDPGLTGALAWLSYDGALLDVDDMPVMGGTINATLLQNDERLLPAVGSAGGVAVAVCEWPGIMPKNGAKANRSVGFSLGTLSCFLAMRAIPWHPVTPGVWKRALNLDSDKTKSNAMAIRLWPDKAKAFMRVKDHGRAEAALLAHWWLIKGGAKLEAV